MYLARLQLAVSYFITSQIATSVLCETKQEISKTLFFLFTSYVTWTYQSHTFSNAIETQLLLAVISLIHLIKKSDKETKKHPHYRASLLLGFIISVGIFNRITFAAFLIFPLMALIKRYLTFRLSFITLIISFLTTSSILIHFDTILFNSTEFVITPLNNLIYNSQTENLEQHGLHPRYTHLLVNLPQILGPAIIPFFFRNHYKTSIPYLAIFSGIFFLSIIPHQELRFLTPLLPLMCICIDFINFESPITAEWVMRLWCVFNVAMGIIMGSLHQRGVIEALDHLQRQDYHGSQVWWRTYSPPTWILGNEDLLVSNEVPQSYSDLVIDLMGAELENLVSTIRQLDETILITPRSSVPLLEHIENVTLEKVWSYKWHLDMDHFDISDLRTLDPGIDIYNAHYNKA
jgi:phosphatidylinositol glycan class Z